MIHKGSTTSNVQASVGQIGVDSLEMTTDVTEQTVATHRGGI